MSSTGTLWSRIEPGLWRPHRLVAVGAGLAGTAAVALLTLLVPLRPQLDTWLQGLHLGGMVGSAKPSDQVLALGITAGFCVMMTTVSAMILWRARRRVDQVRRALDGAEGVVWVYLERSATPAGEDLHVVVFGLSDGAKVRATLAPAQLQDTWDAVRARFAGVSQGHDAGLERSFAVRPALLSEQPRQLDAVQHITGLVRAR